MSELNNVLMFWFWNCLGKVVFHSSVNQCWKWLIEDILFGNHDEVLPLFAFGIKFLHYEIIVKDIIINHTIYVQVWILV